MMKSFNHTFFLRFAVAVILLMHSIPVILNGEVNSFGTLYLDKIGFAPFGLALAWTIKLSHVVCAICFLLNKYLKWASLVTIVILVAGIILIHGRDGWFVIGNGRNGVEFSFLMIFVMLSFVFPNGFVRKSRS